ncbi:MAG: TRAP transporter large permease subunit, partial [Pseudomonadales bacterium]|nr:TRAP transporter large permease subunit [Pseudomonadales bacterium]
MIDPFSLGLLILAVMLLAVIIGIPIPIAVITSAIIGLTLTEDLDFAGNQLSMVVWEVGTGYLLLNLPLFLLMGQLAYRSGFAADLFAVMYRWVGRLPGGINLS